MLGLTHYFESKDVALLFFFETKTSNNFLHSDSNEWENCTGNMYLNFTPGKRH